MTRGKISRIESIPSSSPTHAWSNDFTVTKGYDPSDGTYYKIVGVLKPGGISSEAILSQETLAAGERAVLAALGRAGLDVPVERRRRNAITQAIDVPTSADTVEIHSRVGWCQSEKAEGAHVYITPLRVFGGQKGIRLNHERLAGNHHFAEAGTLPEWIKHVAIPAGGNRLLVFGLALTFVGPILRLLGGESFGVQLYGSTSSGKSIAAILFGSVWGGGGHLGFGQSWLTTDNALDLTAFAHNDAFLVFDETLLAEGRGDLISRSAYRLVNGMDKARATERTKRGDWRIVFLSTSEYPLAELTKQAGARLHGGQAVRLIDIRADGGGGMGIFEDLHGASDPAVFADRIKANAEQYYGTASQRFLKHLVAEVAENEQDLVAWLRGRASLYLEKAEKLRGNSGPTMRVANHFASVFAAGCLASRYKVLPFEPADIGRAVIRAHELAEVGRLKALSHPKPIGADLVSGIAEKIRLLKATFIDVGSLKSLTREDWESSDGGFKRYGTEVTYLFSKSAFRKLCGSADPNAVKRALQEAELLLNYNDGKRCVIQKLPEPLGRIRVTAISGQVMKLRGLEYHRA